MYSFNKFNKKSFIIIFLLFLFFNKNLGLSKEINIIDIENYLNSISSLDSQIVQTNHDGSKLFGSIKLKKPGKLRIEYYNQKADHLIVGSNGIIAVIDYNSNSEPFRYPINGTPLKFLSDNDVNLNNNEIISELNLYKDHISLEISEKNPTIGLGKIILKFKESPLKILGWEIPINEIKSTKIKLNKTIINQNLDDNLFYISAEIMKYRNSKK